MITEMPLPPPPVEEQPLPPPPPGIPRVLRGATEGPLKYLIPVLFDFESYVTKDINLGRMRLRQYLASSWVTALSLTIGFDQPVAFFQYPRPPHPGASWAEFDPYPELTATLRELAADPRFVFVPYNAAFDVRVLRFKMGIEHPTNVWCALEGAMSAWPELPGGFGLGSVAETLNFPPELRKLTIDLRSGKYTPEEYKAYNIRDTEVLREAYVRQIARIKAREQLVGLSTQRQRRMHLLVNEERLNLLIKQLEQNAALAELEAAKALTEDERGHVFNHGEEELKKELKRAAKEDRMPVISDEDRALRSIRSKRLLGIVQEKFGDEINTTSMKKLSPVVAARNPEAAAFLTNVGRANKMVSHRRRSTIFRGAVEVDVELGFARAHTGRFSSPSTGKGLNLHNCVSVFSYILTSTGWTPILDLTKGDLLWDGLEFVPFSEITYEGDATTGTVGLAEITPEQPVWDGRRMIPATLLTRSQRARVVAAGFSSTLLGLRQSRSAAVVLDAAEKLNAWFRTSRKRLDAAGAPTNDVLACTSSGCPPPSSSSCVADTTTWPTGSTASGTTRTRCSRPANMEPASAPRGEETSAHSLNTACAYLDGMIRLSNWIEKTITSGTNRVTSVSLTAALTSATAAILSRPKAERPSSTIVGESVANTRPGTSVSSSAVFDIRGVGPRSRFVCNGIVTANCPKHDLSIAKPIRQTFHLPDDKVAVRGDLANVEYRVNGWMTQCDTIVKMFDPTKGGNLLTDPYMAGWYSMTGVQLKSKKDPVRQVSKSATLGLGFMMSAARYVGELLKVLADKNSRVTETTIRELIESRKWDLPPPGQLKFIITRTGCSELVATAAYHIHRLFNKAHPELRMTANWLVDVVNAVATVGHDHDQARKMIDRWYLATSAPNRDRIDLSIDPDETRDTCSVRVRCGPWVETVCWREPKLRPTEFVANAAADFKLTIRKAYGPSKIFTPSLALENVVQAGARNMLCEGILRLEKLGFMDYIHVHDELMLIVDKNPKAVLHARDNLLKVFGPGGSSPMGWAVLIKPDEVTVTESLYEDEADLYPIFGKDAAGEPDKGIILRPGRWDMIEQNHPECLVGLP